MIVISNDKYSQIIKKIIQCLSRDLLNPKWKNIIPNDAIPVAGHCYVATEAAFHLFGKKDGYYTYVRNDEGITHWWLQDDKGGIVDVTMEQVGDSFPYSEGHKQPMRHTPSARARTLIERVNRLK